jgi:hypothetical protein
MLSESGSLKEKRSVLRKIKDRVQQKFNCAIAEVGDQDAWQAAQLGFVVVSNEKGFTQSMVQRILSFIDDLSLAKMVDDEQDYIDYGDGEINGASSGEYPHWEDEQPAPGRSPRPLAAPSAPAMGDGAYPWEPADNTDHKSKDRP